jgi:ankyrin repeat protein
VYSDFFWVGGCRWRLVAYPRGSRSDDNLSVYVEVVPPLSLGNHAVETSSEASSWSCLASFSFAIVSQLTGERTICREVTAHRFDRARTDLGFPHIVRKHLLSDRKSGFVYKDRLTIEFVIRVHETTCATYPMDSKSGNYIWRVPNLIAQAATSRDQRLTSPLFRIGGCNWSLALYPRGKNASVAPSGSTSHYLSIYLKATPDASVSESTWYYLVNFRVSLVHQVDGSRFSRQVEHKVFRKGVEDWGFPLFMKHSRVFSSSSPFNLDGAVTIHVDIDVLDTHESGSLMAPEVPLSLGWTPLLWAASHGHLDGVRELLVRLQENGVEWEQQVDSRGRNALDWAAFGGHTALVQYLCDTAVPSAFNARDTEGYCALHKALANGHWDTVATLLPFYSIFEIQSPLPKIHAAKSATDISAEHTVESSRGSGMSVDPPHQEIHAEPALSALHLAARATIAQSVYPHDIQYWRLLLGFELSVGGFGTADREGRSVIHSLAASGAISLLEQLLQSGCISSSDLNILDASGGTPLHRAIQRGHYGLVRFLISAGADPQIRWSSQGGKSAFLLSIFLNDIRMAQLLLQQCCNDGETSQATATLSPVSPSLTESSSTSHTTMDFDSDQPQAMSTDAGANFVSSTTEQGPDGNRSVVKRKRSNSAAGGDGPFDRFANRHSRIISRATLTTSGAKKPGDEDPPLASPERRKSGTHAESFILSPNLDDANSVDVPQPQPNRRRQLASSNAPQSNSPRKEASDKHVRSKSGDFSSESAVSSDSKPYLELSTVEEPRMGSSPPSSDSKSPGRKVTTSKAVSIADGASHEAHEETNDDAPPSPGVSHAKRRLSSSSKSTSSGALLSRKRQATSVERVETAKLPAEIPLKRTQEQAPAVEAEPVDKLAVKMRKRARSKSSATAELAPLISAPDPTTTVAKTASQKAKRKSIGLVETSRISGRPLLSPLLAPLVIPNARPQAELAPPRKSIPVASMLLSTDDSGNTAMHWAVANFNLPLVLFLLRQGAAVNVANHNDKTPLDLAIDSGDLRCTISLLENGAQLFGALSGQRLFNMVSEGVDGSTTTQPTASSFNSDMRFLLNNESFSDIIFVVEQRRLHAWKGILCARSEFFRAMFMSPLRESAENHIELTDVAYDIFARVLEYVYTDSLNETNLSADSAVSLLSAANRYMLERLKLLTEEWLVANIADDNVYSLFLAADLYEAPRLKAKCVQYVAANADRILDLAEVVKNSTFSHCVIDVLRSRLQSTHRDWSIPSSSSGASSPPQGSLSPRRESIESVDNG